MPDHDDPTSFYLLPYRSLARRWRTPAFLLMPAGAGLYWAAPHLLPDDAPLAFLALGVSVVGLLLFVYTLLAMQARVTCEQTHLTIRTPLYPVAFSYRRIDLIRPIEFSALFPPTKAKAAHRRIYHELWGKTVPTLTLKGYPLPHWWLRLWFHPYLFHPQEVGLVLPIDDWMTFTRRLDAHRVVQRQSR
jgi:hypothetical protein